MRNTTGYNPRTNPKQRNMDAMVIQILLAHQTMAANRQTIVTRQNKNGTLKIPLAGDSLHNMADPVIQMRYHGIIIGQMTTYRTTSPRFGLKMLITHLQFSIIKRMHSEKVLGNDDLIVPVEVAVHFWSGSWIMGSHESQREKIWLVAIMSIDEFDSSIGKQIGTVFSSLHPLVYLWNLLRRLNPAIPKMHPCLRIHTIRMEGTDRDIPMVIHTPEKHRPSRGERSRKRLGTIMPLTNATRLIPMAPHKLTP